MRTKKFFLHKKNKGCNRSKISLFVVSSFVLFSSLVVFGSLCGSNFSISKNTSKISTKTEKLVNTKVLSSNDSDKKIEIRNNPINGFSGLDVYNLGSEKTKLVLTTISSYDAPKTYGVALVDKNYKILSSWSLADVKGVDTSLNYTTNIIRGPNDFTFFVLAGISNLAKALNSVYSEYGSSSWIDESVTTHLNNAPSIKIFKINVVNNVISSDQTNPFYDFSFPSFPNKIPNVWRYAGLTFYQKNGLFFSFTMQQNPDVSDLYYGAAGYYQYLFYGQLFQYNYNNKDNDEFAIISSPLGSDPQMGNLYAYYNRPSKSLVSALEGDLFYYDVLTKVFKFQAKLTYALKDEYKSKSSKVSYKIKNLNGSVSDAPIDDQLSSTAAISIATMMDYGVTTPFRSDTHQYEWTTLHRPSIFMDHRKYTFAPGWFVFSPKETKLAYYLCDLKCVGGESVWYNVINTEYDPTSKTYLSMLAGPGVLTNQIPNYIMCKFDYFENFRNVENYGGYKVNAMPSTKSISLSDASDDRTDPTFTKNIVGKIFTKKNIGILIDFAQKTKRIGLFLSNKILWVDLANKWIGTDMPTLSNFSYNEESSTISLVLNDQMFIIPVIDTVLAHKGLSTNSIEEKQFNTSLSDNTQIINNPLFDSDQTINIDGESNIKGIVTYLDDFENNKHLVYTTQVSMGPNNIDILGTISKSEVGYQPLKNDTDFSFVEKNQNIADLLKLDYQQLKTLFAYGERKNGTLSNIVSLGCIITKSNEDSVWVSELINYNGKKLIGFAQKHQIALSAFNENFGSSEYSNLFKTDYIRSFVWYSSPAETKKNPILKNISIDKFLEDYNKDYAAFQTKYFDAIVKQIDNKILGTTYELKIASSDVNKNLITFEVVAKNEHSKILTITANPGYQNQTTYTLKDGFLNKAVPTPTPSPEPSPSNVPSTNYKIVNLSIVGIVLAIVLFIIISLVVFILLWKHKQNVKKEIFSTRKDVDRLTVGIGTVFQKLSKDIKMMNDLNRKLLASNQPISKPLVKENKKQTSPLIKNKKVTLEGPFKPVNFNKTSIIRPFNPNPIKYPIK